MATQQELGQVAEEARAQEAAARQAEIDELMRRLAEMEAAANAGRGQPPAGVQAQQQQVQVVGQQDHRALVPAAQPRIRINDVLPTLPRFDGEDVTKPVGPWLDEMEQNGVVCGWSPLETMMAAKQCLEGPAKTWSLRQ